MCKAYSSLDLIFGDSFCDGVSYRIFRRNLNLIRAMIEHRIYPIFSVIFRFQTPQGACTNEWQNKNGNMPRKSYTSIRSDPIRHSIIWNLKIKFRNVTSEVKFHFRSVAIVTIEYKVIRVWLSLIWNRTNLGKWFGKIKIFKQNQFLSKCPSVTALGKYRRNCRIFIWDYYLRCRCPFNNLLSLFYYNLNESPFR